MRKADGSTGPPEIPMLSASLLSGGQVIKGRRFVQAGGMPGESFSILPFESRALSATSA